MKGTKRVNKEQEFYELLCDIQRSRLLTDWEVGFIDSILNGWMEGRWNRKEDLSEKQQEILGRLERKIYQV